MEIRVIIAIVIALAIGFALTRKKKGQKPDATPSRPWVPPVLTDPTPDTPAPVVTPPEPVLIDINGNGPEDPWYDPRAVKPDPEPSPEEPFGTWWGQGPFDPGKRYIDLNGKFHNAG